MGFFKNLFTWWEGATLGTALFSWRHGRKVGEDALVVRTAGFSRGETTSASAGLRVRF